MIYSFKLWNTHVAHTLHQQLINGNPQKHSQTDVGYEFCCHHVLVFISEFTVTLCHSHIIIHLKSHQGTTISFNKPINQIYWGFLRLHLSVGGRFRRHVQWNEKDLLQGQWGDQWTNSGDSYVIYITTKL